MTNRKQSSSPKKVTTTSIVKALEEKLKGEMSQGDRGALVRTIRFLRGDR